MASSDVPLKRFEYVWKSVRKGIACSDVKLLMRFEIVSTEKFIENASSEVHYNLMWMQYAFIVTFPKNVLLLTSQQIRIKLKLFNLNVSKMVSMWTQHYSQLSYSIVLHLIETILFSTFSCGWFCCCWFFGVERYFQQYFSYIMAISFSGGRSRSKWREPPTIGKQLVNFITCGCESSAPFL